MARVLYLRSSRQQRQRNYHFIGRVVDDMNQVKSMLQTQYDLDEKNIFSVSENIWVRLLNRSDGQAFGARISRDNPSRHRDDFISSRGDYVIIAKDVSTGNLVDITTEMLGEFYDRVRWGENG